MKFWFRPESALLKQIASAGAVLRVVSLCCSGRSGACFALL
jgi:hypothetical protein